MTKFIIMNSNSKGVILRKGVEYTTFMPHNKIYEDVVIGKEIEIDDNSIQEKYRNELTPFHIVEEKEKSVMIEYEGKKCMVAKSFGVIQEGKIYLSQYSIDNLKPMLSTAEFKEGFKYTYHKIVGSQKTDDGGVSIEFKVYVKAKQEKITRKELIKADYVRNGKVLGNIIKGIRGSYLHDAQLEWKPGEQPFEVETDYEAIQNYLDKKSDPTQWNDEDLQAEEENNELETEDLSVEEE